MAAKNLAKGFFGDIGVTFKVVYYNSVKLLISWSTHVHDR